MSRENYQLNRVFNVLKKKEKKETKIHNPLFICYFYQSVNNT